MPKKATFGGKGSYKSFDGGAPLAEQNEVEMRDCLRCGRSPTETKTGIARDFEIIRGVVYVNTLCLDCLTPDERAAYEEVRNAP